MSYNATFLLTDCDLTTNYSGCTNLSSFLTANLIFIVLHSISLFLHLIYPVTLFYLSKKTGVKFEGNDYSRINILYAIAHSFIIALLTNVRRSNSISLNQDSASALVMVQGNIVLFCVYCLFGGLAANQIVLHLCKAASGSELYQSFEFRGKKVDPSQLLKLYRVSLAIAIFSTCTLWATVGMTGISYYIYARRANLLVFSIAGAIINPSILLFFSSMVIDKLVKPFRSKGKAVPAKITRIVLIFRSFPVLFYGPVAVFFILYLVISEAAHTNHNAMLISMIICYGLQYIASTYIVAVTIQKAFVGLTVFRSSNSKVSKVSKSAPSTTTSEYQQNPSVSRAPNANSGVTSMTVPDNGGELKTVALNAR